MTLARSTRHMRHKSLEVQLPVRVVCLRRKTKGNHGQGRHLRRVEARSAHLRGSVVGVTMKYITLPCRVPRAVIPCQIIRIWAYRAMGGG